MSTAQVWYKVSAANYFMEINSMRATINVKCSGLKLLVIAAPGVEIAPKFRVKNENETKVQQ
jgi:hypothetical protein